MPDSATPPPFDPADLEQLKELVSHLRHCGVRSFKHPCGLELTIDTQKPAPPPAPEDF